MRRENLYEEVVIMKIQPPKQIMRYVTFKDGEAIIISESGEMLFVDPFFVDYKEHITRFKNGERSVFE